MKRVIFRVLGIVLIVALSGCAGFAPAVPEKYKGPLAYVKDSATVYSSSKADFFYLAKIDDRRIEDSRLKTLDVNYGRGLHMSPEVIGRNIPAQACKVTIVGRTEYAAPILSLTNTVYEVKGEIPFQPEDKKSYIVKGQLGADYSAVWIEEQNTGRIVSSKVEIKGSAELGLFEK